VSGRLHAEAILQPRKANCGIIIEHNAVKAYHGSGGIAPYALELDPG
jgi:hypothetical protein